MYGINSYELPGDNFVAGTMPIASEALAVKSGETIPARSLVKLVAGEAAAYTASDLDLTPDDQKVEAEASGTGITAASVVKATFLEEAGTGKNKYEFEFDGTGWQYDGEAATLNDYGISVTGTPAEGDKVTVTRTVTTQKPAVPYGIAAADAENGTVPVYLSGEFFAEKLEMPEDVTAEDVAPLLRSNGIFLKHLN